MYIIDTMSVKEGSSKETYQHTFEYWEHEIESREAKVHEATDDLMWAIHWYQKMIKQYNREYP